MHPVRKLAIQRYWRFIYGVASAKKNASSEAGKLIGLNEDKAWDEVERTDEGIRAQ